MRVARRRDLKELVEQDVKLQTMLILVQAGARAHPNQGTSFNHLSFVCHV